MAGKTIFLLTVFVSIHLIGAQVTSEEILPELNITRALGKWFFVAGIPTVYIGCFTINVEQPAENTVKLIGNITGTPERIAMNLTLPDESDLTFISAIEKNSNIFNFRNFKNAGFATLVFDIDYDSYMVLVYAQTKDEVTGHGGIPAVLSRRLTLPHETLDKIKMSTFYRQHKFDEPIVFDPVNC